MSSPKYHPGLVDLSQTVTSNSSNFYAEIPQHGIVSSSSGIFFLGGGKFHESTDAWEGIVLSASCLPGLKSYRESESLTPGKLEDDKVWGQI